MNCMSDRTERACVVPVWYMVRFFLSSHQAGTSSHRCWSSSTFRGGMRSFKSGWRNVSRKTAKLPASEVPRALMKTIGVFPGPPAAMLMSSKRAWMSSALLGRPT